MTGQNQKFFPGHVSRQSLLDICVGAGRMERLGREVWSQGTGVSIVE